MMSEVHLIANVGSIETAPVVFGNVNVNYIENLTTIDLTQLPFDCNDGTQSIEVGAVFYVEAATLNPTATVTAYDPNTCTITLDAAITWGGTTPVTCDVTIDITTNTVESVMLDLYPNESISQNWQFQDLQTFGALGSFTRQFRIPATGINVHVIGALDDANFKGTTTNQYGYFHVKLPAEIRVNTLPISTGYLRVMKVYKQLDKFTDFEVTFYAETPDLVKAIGEKKLADLTDLPNLNHVVNLANTAANAVSGDLMYGLCDRGQLWSELGEQNTRPVLNALQPVYAGDLTPALKWSYIMQQIFDDAGFVLDASTLMGYLDAYWMVWCNAKDISATQIAQQFFFSAYINADLNITSTGEYQIEANEELFDNGGDYNISTYTYTSPIIGTATFQSWIKFDIGTSVTAYQSITVRLIAVKNSNVAFPIVLAGNTYYEQSANDVLLLAGQAAIELTIGDTVEFYVQILADIISPADSLSSIDITLLHESDSGLLNEGCGVQMIAAVPHVGYTMNMALNAPDAKQIDFVRDVLAMHNCVIVPNRQIANEVHIEPANTYYGSGGIKDWSSKLDISKDITMYGTQDLMRKKTTFTYASAEDRANKLFIDNGRIYGNYEINGYRVSADDVPSDFLTGEMAVQLVTRSTPSFNIPGTTITIPQFTSDSNEFVAPGMRCLYDAGSYDIICYDDNAEASVLHNVHTWNNYSAINAEFDDYDLNFAPETPLHSIQANPYNNLFNLYWRDYLNSIYSSEARIMDAYFALDLTDIISFSFADQIYVKDAYWRIIEIQDYKIGDVESVLVKLMKIVQPKPDCVGTPVSVGLDGIVNFEDGNGDPVAATRSCCLRYGFTWDGTDCFGNIGDSITIPTDSGEVRRSYAIQSTGDGFNNIISTFKLDAASNVTQSVFAGQFITAPSGNSRTLAVGDVLTIDGDVRGAAMIGKNVLTKTPGFHIGGGWMQDDRTNSNGQVQSGTIMLSAKDGWNASGDAIELLIEGIASNRLNLPNNTGWACTLLVNVATDNIGNYGYGVFTFYLKKTTTTSASAVNTIYTANTFSTFTLNASIDTATNTAQHRLRITATGSGFPHNNIRIVASLHYTQFIT